MSNIRPNYNIYAIELRSRLKLNTIILDTIRLFLSPKEECFKKFSNVLAKHENRSVVCAF